MLGTIIALIVTVITGYFILKKYKAQAVLICAGFIMIAIALMLGYGQPLVSAKESTGNVWFDMFRFVDILTNSRTGGLGLMIMVCAGFAKYMNMIGASEAMVRVAAKPLHLVKSPYIVLCMGFLIGQCLHPFIPSASGFGLLLMVTMYPLYISLGISRTTATAVIATNGCLDLGPSSGNTILAAKYSGLTPVEYFISYQLPVAIAISLVMVVAHYFVAQYFDRKRKLEGIVETVIEEEPVEKEVKSVPKFYALLPTVPVILVLLFGFFKVGGIKMGINVALYIGFAFAMLCEFIRTWNLKEVFKSMQGFFDGMGVQFATVVTLIIAGETFAKGLQQLGAIDYLIGQAENAGFGTTAMILVMCAIIGGATIIMGSGNAPFFAFSAFAPNVAQKVGVEAVNILLPMQLTASIFRATSPIAAVVVAVSGVANVSPFQVVKQTMIPLVLGALTIQVMTFFMF
ncbi:MAG: C4-dicarboxylate transporter DcuC [Veillonella sp.]|uniref:C4-dicarboxylate transporter DcuC n=1 Tax=Veillonella sp. TaxID=1926307 RepID=UPI0025EDC58E|nr:C4-dicarboxylate transporter DcuC [Veillonella sp.]MBS4913042.1 C4-dicarboxylate transporter DcuC [Veillonella sp.]